MEWMKRETRGAKAHLIIKEVVEDWGCERVVLLISMCGTRHLNYQLIPAVDGDKKCAACLKEAGEGE